VLWQKERLLNLALKAVPRTCDKVAWIDCDVIFEYDDWPQRVTRLLDQFELVQLFREIHYLPHDWVAGPVRPTDAIFTRPSAVWCIASGMSPMEALGHFQDARRGASNPGLAWASRRELLDCHGFYDALIIGGGDRAMACACYGCFDAVIGLQRMNEPQKQRYLAWARPFHETVRDRATFLDCNLFHLWHGDLRDRRPTWRSTNFGRFDFDPFEDIALSDNGCWRWNTDKPGLHAFLREYLASRKEDG
jgi:hypothetical protein